MKVQLLFASFLGAFFLVNGQGCNLPPEIWCSSLESAKRCQVEKQCANFWQMQKTGNKLVEVGLYYESLCPYCYLFLKEQLYPAWTKLKSIMNITLVPYGNAQETQKGTQWQFECQHGPDECLGNTVEACVLNQFNFSTAFEIIYCMELSGAPSVAGKQCTEKLSMDYGQVETCVNGTEGNRLLHEMAVKTGALDPPHQYVPWFTLFGVHSDDIQKKAQTDLISLVCDNYHDAKTKPIICHDILPDIPVLLSRK